MVYKLIFDKIIADKGQDYYDNNFVKKIYKYNNNYYVK